MLTIQRNYWADLSAAKEKIDFGAKNPTKVGLYQAIALHLGIDTAGLDIDMLWSAIDAKNMELACVVIAESMVEREATIIDQMAAVIDQPAFRRVAVPPIKRPMPVVKGNLDVASMRPGVKRFEKPKLRVR